MFVALLLVFGEPLASQKQPACQGPAELEQVIRSHPSAGPYNALGAYFGQRNQIACAISAFETAIRLDARSAESHFNLALALIQKGDRNRAQTELRLAIKLQPGSLNARLSLGQLLQDAGDSSGAQEQFRSALTVDPRSTAALANLAQSLMAQRRYTAAIPYLKQAAAVEPGEPSHPLALAVAYAQSGNPVEAVEVLRRIVASHPKYVPAHFNLATVYVQDRRFREAADEFAQAAKLDPANDMAPISAARAHVAIGDHAAALPFAEDYARRRPRDFEGMYVLGLVYRGLRRDEEAVAKLSEAARIDPEHYGVRYNLGASLARLGKNQEARPHLEKAKQLDPTSAEVSFQLAQVLKSLQEQGRANAELDQFRNQRQSGLQEDIASSEARRANQFLGEGHPRQAAELYREALRLDPNNAKTYYNLALALNRLGDRAGERQALEKTVQLDPS
ncbi:MAG: tetratricopeptide repeat protein, partial [Acidobacteria bacterium]|nr:tetratricopeptide repeat protein [Acidobacteriota bacterium]